MRVVHQRRYGQTLSPRVAPFVINQPGVVAVPAAQPAATGPASRYESTFKPSELARMVFGDRPTRTRVYSVRFLAVAAGAAGISTQQNIQKGAIIKEVRGGSSRVNTDPTVAGTFTGNSVYEILLRYGNQDPIFSDFVRGDVLFGSHNELGWVPRPPLIILPQNSLQVLVNNLTAVVIAVINIAFVVEEPAY